MEVYEKVPTNLSFVEREKSVRRFWEENKIFEKSIEASKGDYYTFFDGPPTANGKPHIGHVLTRVIKDMIPRYHTMKGRRVLRKAGWDTHGLPVELEVEKKLGIDGKDQIEAYGLEPFIGHCKESVWQYKGMWEDFSGTVGFWADMEHPYVTYTNDFIESEWWALKKIWDKGLLYKGYKIVPYCPRCGTPLSSHEVAQGYKLVKERSAVVRFRCLDEDAYYLAWTTTPWTLPSNVALCVNPDETYCKVRACDGYTYYMAKALLDNVLGGLAREEGTPAYEILSEMKGIELERRPYEPLFECTGKEAERQGMKAHFVTCDGYVTMSDGTGIVHIAPAFGEDDSKVGKKYGLPFVQFVNGKGEMTEETDYAGVFVKKADPLILEDLKAGGKLFSAPKFEHDYPHCWRCNTPLIYYARDSWFIKMTEVKDKLIANNNTVNWIPETIGKGRFGDWLENVQDWGVSRNRYWGTPLNIWECSCGHKPKSGINDTTSIIALAAISMIRAITEQVSADVKIKWVNDLILGDRKLGGNLIEGAIDPLTRSYNYLIAGIGVNLYKTDFDKEIENIATSLERECSMKIDKTRLVRSFVKHFLEEIKSPDSDELFIAYRERLITVGKAVTVKTVTEEYEATALCLNRDYSLSVITEGGEEKRIYTGEVSVKAK